MQRLMTLAVALAAAMTVLSFETETVGGYTWTYRINGDTAEIDNDYYPAISPSPTGAVTIPSTLGGKPVTSIGASAFHGCSGLASVTIPDGVTSIGDSAFFGCSGLTSVTIPDSVTSIGSSAFSCCSGLTNVTIPDGVTSIGNFTFDGCSALTSVTIPDSVTSIGSSAFFGCSALTSVTIPDGVTSIGVQAFCGCSGLTNVQLPNSVAYVGDYAFSANNNIICLTWPGELGVGRAFSAITVTTDEGTELTYANRSIKTIVIANGSRYIADLAFGSISSVSNVIIPDSVTSIGSSAFSGCSGLTSVMIPDGVTSIGARAFSCTDLTAITIPAMVRWLDDEAFAGCSSLVSVTYLGDAPDTGANIYLGTPRTLVSYVRGGSIGWSGGISSTIPTVWNDRAMVCEWTVTFDAQGGMLEEMVRLVANEDVVGVLPSPTRDGHTFDGWFTEPVGGVRVTSATKVSGHVTYYAHWKANGTETDIVNYGGVVSDMAFTKAQTVRGALYGRDGVPVGTVQVKVGKVNKKKRTVKIAATATLLADGKAKKVAAKAVTVKVGTAAAGTAAPHVAAAITFKAPIGKMAFEMEADGTFTLKNGSYVMAEKKVGGSWTRAGARVYVDVGGGRGATALPAGTIEELLPDGEPVIPKAGKWSFAKAAGVKYAKDKKTKEVGLVVDTKKGTNLSAMKLKYTPKTGIFNGSFKIYAIQGGKLKKFTAKVAGVVVDGKGWGSAAVPKGGRLGVTVE